MFLSPAHRFIHIEWIAGNLPMAIAVSSHRLKTVKNRFLASQLKGSVRAAQRQPLCGKQISFRIYDLLNMCVAIFDHLYD